jgi:hypothetical protein
VARVAPSGGLRTQRLNRQARMQVATGWLEADGRSPNAGPRAPAYGDTSKVLKRECPFSPSRIGVISN